jgi:hypothetical protein
MHQRCYSIVFNITFQQIETFLVVSKCLNLSKAGEILFATQPALSKTLKRFEEGIGIRLFSRSNQGMALTSDGEYLYSILEPLYKTMDRSIQFAQFNALTPLKVLRIVVPSLYDHAADFDQLKDIVTVYERKYPDIKVEVVNGSAGELTARIKAEKDNPQGDLMWGGLGNSDGDIYSDIFEHWLTNYENEVMPDYKSNNGYYSLDHLSTVVLCVNTDLEKKLGLEIKGYADLLNPALKGKIVIADPNESSSAWNNVCNIMAVYGNDSQKAWDFMARKRRRYSMPTGRCSYGFLSPATLLLMWFPALAIPWICIRGTHSGPAQHGMTKT